MCTEILRLRLRITSKCGADDEWGSLWMVAGGLQLLLYFRKMKKKEKFFNFHVHIKAIFSIYIVEGTSL